MPSVLGYLVLMLAVIIVWFMALKRPVYEAVFVSFLVLLTLSGTWPQVWTFVEKGLSTSLLYSMTAFVAMSIVLTKTKVIDGCIAIILSLLGKVPGGAGYVSVIASAFMGALSGSGPGNVMATGSITIPAMKKSGFPAELAANIESNASYLGNMIPPSSNIVAAMGAYMALYPESGLSTGQFWVILWGVSLWFILHRVLTVFAFCTDLTNWVYGEAVLAAGGRHLSYQKLHCALTLDLPEGYVSPRPLRLKKQGTAANHHW